MTAREYKLRRDKQEANYRSTRRRGQMEGDGTELTLFRWSLPGKKDEGEREGGEREGEARREGT